MSHYGHGECEHVSVSVSMLSCKRCIPVRSVRVCMSIMHSSQNKEHNVIPIRVCLSACVHAYAPQSYDDL